MTIDSIQNGVVLDHIQAGKAMLIYRLLELEKLDCEVAIIKNGRLVAAGPMDEVRGQASLEQVFLELEGQA